MPDFPLLPVLAAAAAAFVLSGVYYTAFSTRLAEAGSAVSSDSSIWRLAAEVVRALIVATVVAVLAQTTDASGWADGVSLGLLLWAGFPLVLWLGAVLHEGTSWRLAAIHGGDWLVKLMVVGVIATVWS